MIDRTDVGHANPSFDPHSTRLHGITLIEVIFSMAVVLIGLVGLLSILPLAGQRAQDAVSLSVASQIGDHAVDTLMVKQFLRDGRIKPIRETTSVPFSDATVVNYSPSSLDDAGAPAMRRAIALDPLFASSTTIPTTTGTNGYTHIAFPYYKTNHNPLLDPSTTTSTTWPIAQPRLTRTGITRPSLPGGEFTSRFSAMHLVEDVDGLELTDPNEDDGRINSDFANAQVASVSGGLEYGKRVNNGQFSWLATIDPLPGGTYASITIVVFRNRERLFDVPTATSAPESPDENGIGERIAYVSFASGFSRGAGGSVHLISNANTLDKITTSDWVMLSRNTPSGPVHRWYRVVTTGPQAEKLSVTSVNSTADVADVNCVLPPGSYDIWRNKLYLDGPDWSFNFTDSAGDPRKFADASFADNTYATVMKDVVSVTERTVLVSEL